MSSNTAKDTAKKISSVLKNRSSLLSNNQNGIIYLEALRRSLVRIAIAIGIFSIGGYFAAIEVLGYLRRIAGDVNLVAFGVPEAFFAILKLALVIGLTASMPYALYLILQDLRRIYPTFSRKVLLGFWFGSVLLFGVGVLFSLSVLLPYGARYLLSFEGPTITACISTGKFVSFCSLFIIGFGLVFELPLVMMLLARMGVITPEALSKHRRYAILGATIISAILTPTPDAVNLMLMAVPLYCLFEIGLLCMRL
jgi:sec-independent protein translocase protein TatC